MKLPSRCFLTGLAAALIVCGGENSPPVAEAPQLPLQTALHAHQAPVVDLDGRLHVRADVAAPAGDLDRWPRSLPAPERGPVQWAASELTKAARTANSMFLRVPSPRTGAIR